jgi:hypothetical protein
MTSISSWKIVKISVTNQFNKNYKSKSMFNNRINGVVFSIFLPWSVTSKIYNHCVYIKMEDYKDPLNKLSSSKA